MTKQSFFLLALTVALLGYFLWSFLVSSRYQALCNVTYWSATREELNACKEMKTELDSK
jgi:hypothetical protein